MKHSQNDISQLWTQIKSNDVLDASIIKQIEDIIIDDSPASKESEKKVTTRRTSNRKLASTKSIFGNP